MTLVRGRQVRQNTGAGRRPAAGRCRRPGQQGSVRYVGVELPPFPVRLAFLIVAGREAGTVAAEHLLGTEHLLPFAQAHGSDPLRVLLLPLGEAEVALFLLDPSRRHPADPHGVDRFPAHPAILQAVPGRHHAGALVVEFFLPGPFRSPRGHHSHPCVDGLVGIRAASWA